MIAEVAILGLVTAQRLGELVVARRNTRRLLALGGVEHGAAHYPLIVALHAAWLGGLWLAAPAKPIVWPWLAAYVALQGLRAWTLASIGRRWTTRIITVPGESPIRKGPYGIVPHPNYLIVAAEVAVLPLAFGLWAYAAVFSLLNTAVLAVRLRAETRAWRNR